MSTAVKTKISRRIGESGTMKAHRQFAEPKYMLWNEIQKNYPDRFVLLENPVFKPDSPVIIGGVLRYKHKSIDKVIEVANQLSLGHLTVKYTGGKLDESDVNFIL